jgi:phosphohistidine phosphatase
LEVIHGENTYPRLAEVKRVRRSVGPYPIILVAMQLVIVRHAEADPGSPELPDALRALTPNGRKQARSLGLHLRKQGIEPDAVVSSPLLRARETAAVLAALLGLADPAVDSRLAPGAAPGDIEDAVRGRGETVVVVGHQPDCGRAAAAITGGPEPAFPPCGHVLLVLGAG